MRKDNWNPESEKWNVIEAEKDISAIQRFSIFFKNGTCDKAGEKIMGTLFRNTPDLRKDTEECAREMADILYHKDNASGYHINHITSGKTVFSVYAYDELKMYFCYGVCDSRETAEKEAALLPDAYVDGHDGEWIVYCLDEDATQKAKEERMGPADFIADFDTEEEAKAESLAYQYPEIREYPSEEWWVVVDDRTKKNAFGMLFPSDTRALAFLYRLIQPEAFMRYVEKYEQKEVR